MVLLHAGGCSDPSGHRASNQDSGLVAPWGVAVADGVGGGPAGDLASATLIHRFAERVRGPVTPTDVIAGIRSANWDLRAHIERDPSLEGMATTFTGIFTTGGDELVIAHAGDSRAYRLRGTELRRQTRDDSYVQALVDRGMVSVEDAASHPQRNVITSSLHGGGADVVSVATVLAVSGDRWLLCTDGLTDYVPEGDLAPILAQGSPQGAAAALVSLALQAGTRDNVSVIVADVTDDAGVVAHGGAVFLGSAAHHVREDRASA